MTDSSDGLTVEMEWYILCLCVCYFFECHNQLLLVVHVKLWICTFYQSFIKKNFHKSSGVSSVSSQLTSKLPTRDSQYQKKHSSLTHILITNHPLSATFIYSDPCNPPCSIYVPDSLIAQHLSKSSLVHILVWHPPLHIPYISSSNHCLLFTVHAHTITTCFAVVPRLYHLILVFLSTLYLELYLIP